MGKEALYNTLREKFDINRLLRAEERRNKISEYNKKRKCSHESSSTDFPNSTPTNSSSSSGTVDSPIADITSAGTLTRVKRARISLNKVDPIMFAPIEKKHIFKFSRPNGTVVRFNIGSLVDYLLSSGDFTDPETRIPFLDEHLKEIDTIVTYFYLLFY
jgi:hypothetical protein